MKTFFVFIKPDGEKRSRFFNGILLKSIWANCLLVFFSLIVNAQSASVFVASKWEIKKIDSLEKVLSNLKDDTNKVNILNELSNVNWGFKQDVGIKEGKLALNLAQNIKYNKGIFYAFLNIGKDYDAKGDSINNLLYYTKALQFATSINNKSYISAAYFHLGMHYGYNSAKKAVIFYLKSIDFGNGDCKNKPAYNNLSYAYSAMKKVDSALIFRIKSINCNSDRVKYSDYYEKIDMMQLYNRTKKYTNAINYGNILMANSYEKMKSPEKSTLLEELAESYTQISKDTNYLFKNACIEKAIFYLKLDLALSVNNKTAYYKLYKAFKESGDLKSAMISLEKYSAKCDSDLWKLEASKMDQGFYDYALKENVSNQAKLDSLKTEDIKKTNALKIKQQLTYVIASIVVAVLLLIFSFFVYRERRKAVAERKKSDTLLLNILPYEVAQELRSTGISKARQFDEVTVLFTDFVGFTTVSMRLSPQELVNELDACFKAFDGIMGKFNIEKIKTVGDAYLAVCGLPKVNHAHAENVVQAALEIKDFMLNRHAQLGNKTFEVRIGVHSGNVVAGIVGIKKFAYDIWGDTVNTAARMEQNSEAGKINISETTYALVKDKFVCEYRGEVDAKNKGMMKMYFVG